LGKFTPEVNLVPEEVPRTELLPTVRLHVVSEGVAVAKGVLLRVVIGEAFSLFEGDPPYKLDDNPISVTRWVFAIYPVPMGEVGEDVLVWLWEHVRDGFNL